MNTFDLLLQNVYNKKNVFLFFVMTTITKIILYISLITDLE